MVWEGCFCFLNQFLHELENIGVAKAKYTIRRQGCTANESNEKDFSIVVMLLSEILTHLLVQQPSVH